MTSHQQESLERRAEAVADRLQALIEQARQVVGDLERRLRCANCDRLSDEPAREWRTYLTDDEPPIAEHFCPDCAEEEFDA